MRSKIIYAGERSGNMRISSIMIFVQDCQCVFSKACFVPAGPQQTLTISPAFPCKFRFQSSVLGDYIVNFTYMLVDSVQITAYAFGIHIQFSTFLLG